MATRIIIVDDHELVRDGLKRLLEREPDFQVVGAAGDGRSAVELADRLSPDVILMDITIPLLNGIDAARQILAANRAIRIIGVTAHCDGGMIREMLRAGACGYVLKDSPIGELIRAIRVVVSGRIYLSARIGGAAAERMDHDGGAGAKSLDTPDGAFVRLTPREREVLQLISEGRATKEIALILHISLKTAETHRRSIMEKLGLFSVAELTKYAIRHGLTTAEC